MHTFKVKNTNRNALFTFKLGQITMFYVFFLLLPLIKVKSSFIVSNIGTSTTLL